MISNHLTNEEELIKKMQYLDLKVLWVNGNPIEESEALGEFVKNKTKIEMFNSKFTRNCTEWGLKYVQKKNAKYAFDEPSKNITKLNLDDRNIYQIDIGLLNAFPNLHDLSLKNHEVSSEAHRATFKNLLETNKNLRMLRVDYETELSIYEMFKMN